MFPTHIERSIGDDEYANHPGLIIGIVYMSGVVIGSIGEPTVVLLCGHVIKPPTF